jgi:hypothetical protein
LQQINTCIPVIQADGSTAPPTCILNGSVKATAVKSALTDEDPVFMYTGSGNVRGMPQWNGGIGSLSNEMHNLDLPTIQSGFGPVAMNSLGNEITAGLREKASTFYGLLPPMIDERGIAGYKIADSVNGKTWATFNQVNGNTALEVTSPMLVVKNSSSVNALGLEIEISRNIWTVPTEQAIATNPQMTWKEVEFRLPVETLHLGATGAAHLSASVAHKMAISRGFSHPTGRHAHPAVHAAAHSVADEGKQGSSWFPELTTQGILSGIRTLYDAYQHVKPMIEGLQPTHLPRRGHARIEELN